MNINYHYHVIKTLALKAEIAPETAEMIAFYSQMIDDFDVTTVFSRSINIKQVPPEFFLQNRLASRNSDGTYTFYPVTTKIGTVTAMVKSTELMTLVPFHFITTRKVKELRRQKKNLFRCVKASELNGDELINQLLSDVNHVIKDKRDVINMGIFLHTYADTYAHQGFSGFWGYENYSLIKSTTCNMKRKKKLFFYNLPAVGHANVGHLPDVAMEQFTYTRLAKGVTKLTETITRDNIKDYEICSRRIFNLLCSINGQIIWNDQKWNELYERIKAIYEQVIEDDSEKTEAEDLNPIWKEAFASEGYDYTYNANTPPVMITPNVEQIDYEALKAENLLESDIYNMFSENGRKARDYARINYTVNDDFFTYNELAYRRIKKVCGWLPTELVVPDEGGITDVQ
jgi:hypothetical protein